MSEYSVNCHWVMTHCVWGPVSISTSVCSSITQSGLSQCLVILSRISWPMFILAMTISVLLRICKISSWTLCCSGCWVIKQTVFSSSLWARATNSQEIGNHETSPWVWSEIGFQRICHIEENNFYITNITSSSHLLHHQLTICSLIWRHYAYQYRMVCAMPSQLW